MKREESCEIRTSLFTSNEDMRDDVCAKGDNWKPPSPTSCSDSTIGSTVIVGTEEDHQFHCSSVSWDDEWTLEAPLMRRPVTILQIPLKRCRSREVGEHDHVQMRTLKRQKTRFSLVLVDTSDSEEEPAMKRSKRIRFKETVDVLPIPMRSEYTLEMRSNVWSSAREIQENAARNTMEFAHDGWDWRKVADEELFLECCVSGRRMHPVHSTSTQLQTR